MRLGLMLFGAAVLGVTPSSAVAAPRASAAAPVAGKAFRDCPQCPEMIAISSGSFVMGETVEDEVREGVLPGHKGRAIPQHAVSIRRSYAIGKYPITRGEFAAFVADTGYRTLAGCFLYTKVGEQYEWTDKNANTWRDPGFPQTDRHPAICVTWNDTNAYAKWLSAKTGHIYRLPSEAEWEFAARAGSTTVRPWGDGRDQICDYGNTADQTLTARAEFASLDGAKCADRQVYTAPVGSSRPNALGLYDMFGNVWQWVDDCFNPSYQGAPADGSAWSTGTCTMRVHRGSAWSFVPTLVRSAQRMRDMIERRETRGGFRLVRAD